jgi:hypothetical protein
MSASRPLREAPAVPTISVDIWGKVVGGSGCPGGVEPKEALVSDFGKYLWIGGLFGCLVGAILAFTLRSDPALIGVRLKPLGLIVLALGAVLLGAAAMSYAGSRISGGASNSGEGGNAGGSPPAAGISDNPIRAVGSLLGLVAGISAVVILGIVTLTKLDGGDKDSMVAIATSAFGVVSAIVGAFLGIKVTADQGTQIATSAQKDAQAATGAVAAANQAADQLPDEAKRTVQDAIKTGGQVMGETPGQVPGAS